MESPVILGGDPAVVTDHSRWSVCLGDDLVVNDLTWTIGREL